MSEKANQQNPFEAQREAVLSCTILLADSPTFKHVLDFAFRMEAKLAKNRHKGDREGWLRDSAPALLDRLYEEAMELGSAIERQESFQEIADEAADVANFAMMIADVCGELTD